LAIRDLKSANDEVARRSTYENAAPDARTEFVRAIGARLGNENAADQNAQGSNRDLHRAQAEKCE